MQSLVCWKHESISIKQYPYRLLNGSNLLVLLQLLLNVFSHEPNDSLAGFFPERASGDLQQSYMSIALKRFVLIFISTVHG